MTSVYKCQELCQQNADCHFFVYYGPGSCDLKGSGADATRAYQSTVKDNYISGPKYCPKTGGE